MRWKDGLNKSLRYRDERRAKVYKKPEKEEKRHCTIHVRKM